MTSLASAPLTPIRHPCVTSQLPPPINPSISPCSVFTFFSLLLAFDLAMDKSASIAAAFGAGKLPSQKQLSNAIDNALNSPFLTNKPSPDVGQLSEQGQQLQDAVRQLLLASKKLGDNKNCTSRESSTYSISAHATI